MVPATETQGGGAITSLPAVTRLLLPAITRLPVLACLPSPACPCLQLHQEMQATMYQLNAIRSELQGGINLFQPG